MNYRVHFSSGNTLVISEKRYLMLARVAVEDYTSPVSVEDIPEDPSIIMLENVDYVIPEPESTSEVIKQPTVQDLKDAEKKKREAIIADPKKVLSDIQNNEGGE